ncbi:NAD-dependent epimerase/dehydratase family protein [Sulfodiicoccus acidiphilus]|uniref:NAD-dependent epimerase/dehydratase family protein n=1 Tax=Sulfodiicoccus acidiphilus TaxID=1670455 RepID=UPI000F83C809|nr:NAD-dependent epimerase/dehydratase family protein [Sulfodiicoccus acidiphilus]
MHVVAGGAGYIGGHLTDRLLEMGEDVLVLDDMSSGNYFREGAKYLKVDLRFPISLELPRGFVLYNLVANPDVRTSMYQVEEHFERDVKTALNLMEFALKSGASRVVFTSSSTVYGETDKFPTPEDHPLKPVSNYGLFKVVGEQLCEFYSRNYSLPCVVLRLANITGGRTSHGVVVDFVRKLRRNPATLEILGDGRQRKSYLYVQDLIEAILKLSSSESGSFEVFNVGNEDWVTVEEIARIVEAEMNLSPRHVYLNRFEGRGWPGDVRLMLLSVERAKSRGWKPTMSSAGAVKKAVRDLLDLGI